MASENIEDIPSIENILVSMDGANRSEQEELQNTMKALLKRADLDGVPQEEYLKLAILIAFRRRNHIKSMAGGVGSGEKLIMLTILRAVSAVNPELVVRVLPLIPMYGSWRDIRLLGDMVYAKEPSSSDQQVRASVSALFANQLRRDLEAAGFNLDGSTLTEKKDEKKRNISLACKYAPSSSRHRGSKKTRTGEGQGISPSSGRGGKGKGKGGKGGALFSPEAAAASREINHESQSAMTEEVARKLGLRPTHLKADLRKLVISPLNNKLTEDGYLIERLMVERRCSEIRFRRAGKSALNKYKNAINKDPVAARRWKSIMDVSATAVPDIDDLFLASTTFLDVLSLPLSDDEVIMNRRAISKAIYDAVIERERLSTKAKTLLTQLSLEKDQNEAIATTTCVLESVEVPCLVIVDLGTATSRQHAVAMLLGAFITTRAQEREGLLPLGSGSILVHYNRNFQSLIPLPYTPEDEIVTAAEDDDDKKKKSEPESSRVDGDDFALFFRVVEDASTIFGLNQPLDALSIETASSLLLNDAEVDIHATSPYSDVLVLCGNFVAGSDDSLETCIQSLKESTTNTLKLRALLVHRCKPSSRKQGETQGIAIPLVPRRGLRPMPSNPADVEVDICFLMDLTGSMGSWMSACKQHLREIIFSLRDETGVGNFRVGFVGYRDYRDSDRIVSINFKSMNDVQSVVDFIGNEEASGGADEPEDIVIGLKTCHDTMSWKGHIRLCIHIADATGHGLTQSLTYVSDDYPKGTPDQKYTTEQISSKLANPDGPGVDMLFCQLNDRTVDVESVYTKTYGGQGFGVLPLSSGSDAFKAAILSTLSESLLCVITPEMSSVQTFDGSTLSATLSAMNANYKESLQNAGKALTDLMNMRNKAKAVTSSVADSSVVVSAVESSSIMTDDEVVIDAVPVTEPEEKDDEVVIDAVPVTEPEQKESDEPVVEESSETLQARCDYKRLMDDLEGEDLVPVRIALQMSSGHGGVLGISEIAAKTLLENGITIAQVNDAGYPLAIVDVFKAVGTEMVRHIA